MTVNWPVDGRNINVCKCFALSNKSTGRLLGGVAQDFA